jgi:hypothetical protein
MIGFRGDALRAVPAVMSKVTYHPMPTSVSLVSYRMWPTFSPAGVVRRTILQHDLLQARGSSEAYPSSTMSGSENTAADRHLGRLGVDGLKFQATGAGAC